MKKKTKKEVGATSTSKSTKQARLFEITINEEDMKEPIKELVFFKNELQRTYGIDISMMGGFLHYKDIYANEEMIEKISDENRREQTRIGDLKPRHYHFSIMFPRKKYLKQIENIVARCFPVAFTKNKELVNCKPMKPNTSEEFQFFNEMLYGFHLGEKILVKTQYAGIVEVSKSGKKKFVGKQEMFEKERDAETTFLFGTDGSKFPSYVKTYCFPDIEINDDEVYETSKNSKELAICNKIESGEYTLEDVKNKHKQEGWDYSSKFEKCFADAQKQLQKQPFQRNIIISGTSGSGKSPLASKILPKLLNGKVFEMTNLGMGAIFDYAGQEIIALQDNQAGNLTKTEGNDCLQSWETKKETKDLQSKIKNGYNLEPTGANVRTLYGTKPLQNKLQIITTIQDETNNARKGMEALAVGDDIKQYYKRFMHINQVRNEEDNCLTIKFEIPNGKGNDGELQKEFVFEYDKTTMFPNVLEIAWSYIIKYFHREYFGLNAPTYHKIDCRSYGFEFENNESERIIIENNKIVCNMQSLDGINEEDEGEENE